MVHLPPSLRSSVTGVAVAIAALCMASCGEEQIEEQQVPRGAETVPDAPAMSPGAPPPPAGEQAAAPDQAGAAGEPAGEAPGDEAADPWVVPVGWTLVPGERPMRVATFEAPSEEGPVEIAITQFPGRVGGELANINRWRGQMGLAAVDEGELESVIERFEGPGFDGYQARIEGEDMHMLAAGVYEEAHDRTWFVRADVAPGAVDELAPQIFGFARSIAGLEPAEAAPASATDPEASGGG